MSNMEPGVLANFEEALCQIIDQCEKRENEKKFGPGGKPDYKWCHDTDSSSGKKNYLVLGNEKDKCCEEKVKERKGKSKREFSKTVDAQRNIDVRGGGSCTPDVIVGKPPFCDAVYDFKTSCPLTPSSEADWPIFDSEGDRKPPNPKYDGKSQGELYKDVCGIEPKIIHPNSDTCTGQLSFDF